MPTEKAAFGLGCVWHAGDFFSDLAGVTRVRIGSLGSDTGNPTVRDIGKDSQFIELEFDPGIISYAGILSEFWRIHDPQARSSGSAYASVIFTYGKDQYIQAKEALTAQEVLTGEDVPTQILPIDSFYPPPDFELKTVPGHHKVGYKTSC